MEPKQIIIFLIIIAVYLFKVIRKANVKKLENQQNTEHDNSNVIEEYEEVQSQRKTFRENQAESYDTIDYSQMLKNRQIIAESLETGSLEGENYDKKTPQKKHSIYDQKMTQNIDNEIDETIELSTEIDDIKRGFLYGEILKRKYN